MKESIPSPPQALYNVLTQLARYQFLHESVGDHQFVEMSDSMMARFEGQPQIERPNVIRHDEESFFAKVFQAFGRK